MILLQVIFLGAVFLVRVQEISELKRKRVKGMHWEKKLFLPLLVAFMQHGRA